MHDDRETGPELLRRLGVDGKLWAEEFHKHFPSVEVDDAIGWFCNAMMAMHDYLKGSPVHNGDHAQYLLDNGKEP